MKKFLKWLGVQEAFEKGLIARILVILSVLFACFGAVFVITRIVMNFMPGFPAAHWTDLLIESLIGLSGVIAVAFLRIDRLQATSRVIMGSLLAVLSLQAYFIGDPANDIGAAVGLLLFAFLAIVLLDRIDRLIAILLVISVYIGLYVLSSAGYLQPAVHLTPLGKTFYTFFVWLSVGVIFSVVLIAAMGAMRREPQLLKQQITDSATANDGNNRKDLSYISTHDALTGVYNRLFFETEFSRLENSRLFPISIIAADIDGLKNINDTSGARAGDQMLIDVARLFIKVFRQEDIVSRYDDDQFVILLPSSDASVVNIVMERIHKQIDDFNHKHSKQPVNISIGVSTAQKGDSLKDHLKLAGKQMQQEKLSKSRV